MGNMVWRLLFLRIPLLWLFYTRVSAVVLQFITIHPLETNFYFSSDYAMD